MKKEIESADKMIEIYEKELNSLKNSDVNPEELSVKK